jgi:predicted nucleic acid-binding protein
MRREIIVDANIFLSVILNEPEKSRIITLTQGHTLVVPEVFPYEIGNALSAMMKRKRLDKEQALQSFAIFETIPLRLIKVDITQAINLAHQFNIYAYDAYYLEIALRLQLPLMTLDKQMKTTGYNLQLNMVEV